MASYGLDFFDSTGRSLFGGLGGPAFRSASPIPIPLVGEIVAMGSQRWRVQERQFDYNEDEEKMPDGDHETYTLVRLRVERA